MDCAHCQEKAAENERLGDEARRLRKRVWALEAALDLVGRHMDLAAMETRRLVEVGKGTDPAPQKRTRLRGRAR